MGLLIVIVVSTSTFGERRVRVDVREQNLVQQLQTHARVQLARPESATHKFQLVILECHCVRGEHRVLERIL